MNRIVVAVLAALTLSAAAVVWPEWSHASTGPSAAAPAQGDTTGAAEAFKPGEFKVTLIVLVNGEPVFDIDFPHDQFATGDECKAYVLSGDPELAAFGGTLAEIAHREIAPRFAIAAACLPTAAETPGEGI